ncbi:MAG: glutamate racemase [Sphingobacteriaceae bacterium]|nr:glutamate racemase [Sphingobacteriaceae bacterium]
MKSGPIGVFDSGYGGLTVLKALTSTLPQYDYLYLGDNARVPYGTRSFETVYQYTWECVQALFSMGCPLVILACNTASAKALRSIQQEKLPHFAPNRRVLGVIRPTTEEVGLLSTSKHVGILGTPGTISSDSYPIEIAKFYPELKVSQEACPLWVPLVENNQHLSEGASYFVQQHLEALQQRDPQIDTVVLGCTHYPLLLPLLEKQAPKNWRFLAQGELVAGKLAEYLQRHPEMESQLSTQGQRRFLTTDSAASFSEKAALFYGEAVQAEKIELDHYPFTPDAH